MKISSLILALAFCLSGVALAAENDEDGFESGYESSNQSAQDSAADDRVACIENAISEEVEEGQQFDAFVDACVQDEVAQKQKSKPNKS